MELAVEAITVTCSTPPPLSLCQGSQAGAELGQLSCVISRSKAHQDSQPHGFSC